MKGPPRGRKGIALAQYLHRQLDGHTAQGVADKCGLAETTVRNLVSGRTLGSRESLSQLCEGMPYGVAPLVEMWTRRTADLLTRVGISKTTARRAIEHMVMS